MSPSGSPLEKSHKVAKVSSHPTFSLAVIPSYGATNAVKVGYDMNADHHPSPVFGTLSHVTWSWAKAGCNL